MRGMDREVDFRIKNKSFYQLLCQSIVQVIFDRAIIYMKGGSEETVQLSHYTFSLRATSHKKSTLEVEHQFRPVWCQKTLKAVSVVPSYRSAYALPFQTEADLPFSSLKFQPDEVIKSSIMLTPKPTTRFCQVCRETFEDYLKHISHPLHLQKAQEIQNDLDFNLLKELMNKSTTKKKRVAIIEPVSEDNDLTFEKSSLKCEDEARLEENFSFGSKKRIVVNGEGDMEAISLSGSTKGIEDEDFVAVRRSQRQYSLPKENKF